MKYGITVKNRFTGKNYEEHDFISLNGVYKVQDAYMFQPWVKMTVWRYGEDTE